MRTILVLFIMACSIGALAQDSPVRRGGGHSGAGNGGDVLVKRFEEGRAQAVKILEEIPHWMLKGVENPDPDDLETLEEWYKRERDEFIRDVKLSPHFWAQNNLNGLCGLTYWVPQAPISLSITACANYTVEEAAAHLIGESAHHFQKGDRFISVLANALMKIWRGTAELRKGGYRLEAIKPHFGSEVLYGPILLLNQNLLPIFIGYDIKYSEGVYAIPVFLKPVRYDEFFDQFISDGFVEIKTKQGRCRLPAQLVLILDQDGGGVTRRVTTRLRIPKLSVSESESLTCPHERELGKDSYTLEHDWKP